MTATPKYQFDLLNKAIEEGLLDNDKAFELVEMQTKIFASVNLHLFAIASSEDFVKFILAENQAQIESNKMVELEKLTKQNEELVNQILKTSKDFPQYNQLIQEQKHLAETIADLTEPYAGSIIQFSQYVDQIKTIKNKLDSKIAESSKKGKSMKKIIRYSKLRIRMIMFFLATLIALISDYLTVYIEDFIGIKALHILIVVTVTLMTLIWIEPELKKIEARRSKATLLEHLELVERNYNEYKTELDKICTKIGIADTDLIKLLVEFNKKYNIK